MAEAKAPTIRVTPKIQGRNLRALTAAAFDPGELKAPIVGDYGRRGAVPSVQWEVPVQFRPEALVTLSDAELQSLYEESKAARKQLRKDFGTVDLGRDFGTAWKWATPERDGLDLGSQEGAERLRALGYTPITYENDENSSTMWLSPQEYAAYKRREEAEARANAADAIMEQIRTAIGNEIGNREQARRRAENQLYAGIVEAGYEFAPGALNDPNVRAAIWENRNSPGYFETAAARNFLRNTADPRSRHAAEQRAFTVDDLLKMGVSVNQGTDQGVIGGTTIIEPGGRVRRPTTGIGMPTMPYNPADPLSEAAYYGGQSQDLGALIDRPLPRGPLDPDISDMLRNPDDWEPDPTYNPVDGRMDMRWRRKLRPYAVGDRIVRDAGNTAYGNLRPGFYSAGSITGPQDVPRVGPAPRSTLMRAPRIRSTPTIVGRTGVI